MDEKLWQAIEWYLANNISVIPVRDAREEINGKTYEAKTPIGSWKEYQQNIIHRDKLWDILDKRMSAAVGIVCGKVSGNLEIIDIDEKYNPGISAFYFKEIKTLFPDIYAKLRVHRSPSGGFHILYRCEELLTDGNMKLASRDASEEELKAKPKEKVKCFIETRGEGGYAVAPPAMGYTVVQNLPIPVLSVSERNCLINLAKCYDTAKKIEKFTAPAKDVDYYDENPFDHFNRSADAPLLLTNYGWQVAKETSQYIHFTRPEKKAGISASFIKAKGVFYIFTTSTEFDGSKGYNPATVLAILQFGGDKKKTYQYLVENGYGRVAPHVERRIIRSAVLSGGQLPKNFSEEAKKAFEEEKGKVVELYPHGVFWSGDPIAGYKIRRELLYKVAALLGFVLHDDVIYRICPPFVVKVSEREFFDTVKAYIKEDPKTREFICDAYESFLPQGAKFFIKRLPQLDTSKILQSTRTISFKFFRNCFLQINKDGYSIHQYSELQQHLVWEDDVRQRDFSPAKYDDCLYADYLNKAILNPAAVQPVIGYLSHEYKDESMGYIVVLTEAVADPKAGGGSGKNIFCSLLSGTTTHKDVAGSQVQLNEKFLQAWNGERVFSISDAPRKFDFAFLKSLSTNTGVLKKLFKDEVSVDASKMPKLVVSTNFSFEITDGGVKRRIIPVEFTDYFTRIGGVDAHYGKMFPADWSAEDWNGYDNFIVSCIVQYLSKPKLVALNLSEDGWKKQFDINYGATTREFIEEGLELFVNKGQWTNSEFSRVYQDYCSASGVPKQYTLSAKRLSEALEEYCLKKHIPYKNGVSIRDGLSIHKGKRFGKAVGDAEAPF